MLKNFLSTAVAFALAAMLSFSPLPAEAQNLGGNVLSCGAATGAANAATLANRCGVITTEAASTAAGATFTETITGTGVFAATDVCFASVAAGGTGTPAVTRVTPTANTLAVIIQNIHSATAFNAALVISYICFKP